MTCGCGRVQDVLYGGSGISVEASRRRVRTVSAAPKQLQIRMPEAQTLWQLNFVRAYWFIKVSMGEPG